MHGGPIVRARGSFVELGDGVAGASGIYSESHRSAVRRPFVASLMIRVKRGKTERGEKRNTCIQPTFTKQGINRTTSYHRALRYTLQRIHACKSFGLTTHRHRIQRTVPFLTGKNTVWTRCSLLLMEANGQDCFYCRLIEEYYL